MHTHTQVGILIRELCRLHNCPLPPDLDNLTLQFPRPGMREHMVDGQQHAPRGNRHIEAESEGDGEEDPEENISDDQEGSDVEEDLPLEMDDGKSTNKVRDRHLSPLSSQIIIFILSFRFPFDLVSPALRIEGRDGGRTFSHFGEIKTKPAAGLSEGTRLSSCVSLPQ